MPYKDPEKKRDFDRRYRKANKEKLAKYHKDWRENNPDKTYADSRREWVKNNPDKVRNFNLKKRFGIDISKYNEMFSAQNGVCAICKQPSPESLHVDHDHVTGKIRGLLHRKCNLALGGFNDNVELLRNAIEYLNGQDGPR